MLDGYLQPAGGAPRPAKPMWAPRGLMAVRANGEEFPSEATISPVHAGGSRLLTIILRDVTDREKVERALQRSQQERQLLQEAMEAEYRRQTVVGTSKRIRALLADVDVVAATDATVLITGETGTGKELVAKEIHQRSPRRDRVLVKVNCAALPGELVESELFGHERGAFTGATQQKKGRFELADGGTIFLDEVGELSASAQAKLLRVLQEQEFERVGGTRTLRVDARVVAATNRDLEQMVDSHAFRADLYYRLNVFPLLIPPLRERKEDIPVLVEYFLGNLARKLGKALESVSEPSAERLMAYHWPGNVRELHNVVERAAILARGPVVEIQDLAVGGPAPAPDAPDGGTLDEVQRRHIQSILELTHGVVEGDGGAAAILGLNASTLRFRMKKLGIRRP
jgi:transcriptional regulator with GAF, ATPase, and Fis domain